MSGRVPLATHSNVPMSSLYGIDFILVASSDSGAGHCDLVYGTLLSIGVEYGFNLPLGPLIVSFN